MSRTVKWVVAAASVVALLAAGGAVWLWFRIVRPAREIASNFRAATELYRVAMDGPTAASPNGVTLACDAAKVASIVRRTATAFAEFRAAWGEGPPIGKDGSSHGFAAMFKMEQSLSRLTLAHARAVRDVGMSADKYCDCASRLHADLRGLREGRSAGVLAFEEVHGRGVEKSVGAQVSRVLRAPAFDKFESVDQLGPQSPQLGDELAVQNLVDDWGVPEVEILEMTPVFCSMTHGSRGMMSTEGLDAGEASRDPGSQLPN